MTLPDEYRDALLLYFNNDDLVYDHIHLNNQYARVITKSEAFINAFHNAADFYNWYYYSASGKRSDKAKSKIKEALEASEIYIRKRGNLSLADRLEEEIDRVDFDSHIATKSQVLDSFREELKYHLVPLVCDNKKFDEISARLKELFVDLCEEFPQKEPPEHYDSEFEPPL